ncbi:MAG: hypothetical protein KAJ10_15830 [Thermodesulfovibrionia bacterium]|nr:hypothetical protein [Thermodesulfovibrionia bacterium]
MEQDSVWMKLAKLVAIIWGYKKVQSIDNSLYSLREIAEINKQQIRKEPRIPNKISGRKAQFPGFPILQLFLLLLFFVITKVLQHHPFGAFLHWVAIVMIVVFVLGFAIVLLRATFKQSLYNYEFCLIESTNKDIEPDTFFQLGFYQEKLRDNEKMNEQEIEELRLKIIGDHVTIENKLAFISGCGFYRGQMDEINQIPITLALKNWPDKRFGNNDESHSWYLLGREIVY